MREVPSDRGRLWLPASKRRTITTVFNLGVGEIVVLGFFGLIFFGPRKLPDLVQVMRSRLQRDGIAPPTGWTPQEWLLVGGALLLGTLAIALVAARG